MSKENIYNCLEPRGDIFDIQMIALGDRLKEINSRTVYFVDNGKQGSEFILKTALGLMKKQYPNANLVYYPKTSSFNRSESEDWWEEIKKNADVAVISLGD